MQSDLTIDLMFEAISPITHMSGTEGNEAVLMREPVAGGGTIASVPVLTGNAIRHRALRQSGYLWMIAKVGLHGTMKAPLANFLINGGAVNKSTRDADLKAVAEGAQLMPLLAMLGGCLPNQIIPGRASVGRGVMACRENQDRLGRMYPDWSEGIARLRSADDFVGGYQYTRGDAARYVETDAATGDPTNLMIFSGESVITGSVFFCRIHLRRPTDLQAGAVLHALSQWDERIGGQSSRGHGQLDVAGCCSPDVDVPGLIESYVSHIEDKADAIKAWLQERFK